MLKSKNRTLSFCLPHLRRFILLLIFTAIASSSQAVEHQDSLANERIQFLHASIKSDQLGNNQWWYGWLAGYGAATIAQGAVFYGSGNKGTRQDMALGASTTLVGVIGQFISPFQPGSFIRQFDLLPEGNEAERLAKITRMEQFLSDRSHLEIESRKWKAHILCTGVNLVSGLVTWLGFHRTVWDGVSNFALNCVITEAQIWSQPIRAKKALKQYQERFAGKNIGHRPSREVNWNLVLSANGAGVKVTF